MSILAVYESSDLRCPRRVLTHVEDIRRALDALGLSLATDAVEASAAVASRTHDAHGLPAYQQVEEQLTKDNIFSCGAVERQVLAGQLRLCLGGADWALVFALRAGDCIRLPHGLEQCILPAAGVACCWKDSAADESALIYHPLEAPALAGLLPLDI